MVQFFNKSNLFGIVGSDVNQKLNQSEVIVWDDNKQKILYKFKIKKKVLNLKLTFDKIIVVCDTLIYIFNSNDFQLIDIIETGYNPKGLIAVNNIKVNDKNEDRTILVYPSCEDKYGKLTIKNYEQKNFIYLNPHENEVTFFSLSSDGQYLATVGKNDSKLRIYNPKTGKNLDELTIEKNDIKFISFCSLGNILATSCEKDIIDIWSLKKASGVINEKNSFFEDTNDININVTNIHIGFFHKSDKPFNHIILKHTFENYQFIGINDLAIITTSGLFYHVNFEIKKKTTKKEGNFKIIEEKELF